ncbi:hypothetical protein HanHA300_Chr08g0279061 [Helianthus annuus]|nr:hypothetical protein HanHA300_Chr08g0279061 [Helianthus annuus]KAJ0553423.1 hypothetical protein HanHA89_Chr08g0296241 [Helianthus annuus]KAJ0719083.1 hypothetical protein HanLR1_Chr08g0277811 [Helianthus annuus]
MVAAAPFNTPRVQGNSFSFVMDKAGDICQNRKAKNIPAAKRGRYLLVCIKRPSATNQTGINWKSERQPSLPHILRNTPLILQQILSNFNNCRSSNPGTHHQTFCTTF